MHYEAHKIDSIMPEPTNREQRRLAAKDPCWYLHKPEWWQRMARR